MCLISVLCGTINPGLIDIVTAVTIKRGLRSERNLPRLTHGVEMLNVSEVNRGGRWDTRDYG